MTRTGWAQAAQRRQADYYTATAGEYDRWHLGEPQHDVALRFIAALATGLGCRSALDVGTGTGRGMRFLDRAAPGLDVFGIEPVQALADRAVHDGGVAPDRIVIGSGESLPFPDEDFDLVFETGILHHVPNPAAIVAEMLRVARVGVFLSDDNRFGFGPWPWRAVKVGLVLSGLWPTAYRLRTRGQGYRVTETDGVGYSYSPYDSFGALARWGRVFAIGTEPVASRSWLHPLMTSKYVLMGSVRD
jgi:SAM-dependent methyltransferase